MTEQNPLLSFTDLPPFSKIQPKHIRPAVEQAIADCRAMIEKVTAEDVIPTYDNVCAPLNEVDDRLSRIWSPIGHMNSVVNSSELREAYESCLPLLSEFGTWAGQHKGLYKAYTAIKESPDFAQLDYAKQKAVNNALRDFRLSGIGLPIDKQKQYGEISKRLSELGSTFSNNVLDASMGWSKLVQDASLLTGLPESALSAAKAAAAAKGEKGWLFTLEFPSYLPVMTYADNQALRAEMYKAFSTRASDQGPNAKKWDNSEIMVEELKLRYELARLLGFNNYAEKSLATKMANTTDEVISFLNDLASRARAQGEQEIAELQEFVKSEYGIDELQPWDIGYYSEKLKHKKYSISDEALRPYFPEKKVISGLFEVMDRVFDMKVVPHKEVVDTWHKDVSFYDIFDKKGILRGSFYLDLYAREHKRGGAWMDECRGARRTLSGEWQTPVAYLTCNFNKPLGDKPALFTHDEVQTLFHEFGHGIHHMLTKIEEPNVSGINGVPWDAVEQPSQFMENWCWQPEALAFISGHVETGEPLPQEMLDKMLAAKNYHAAMFILRQLEFALFDFRLHNEYDPEIGAQILDLLQDVKKQVAVVPSPEWNRFPHAFSHIFAGGYAAGYYSYLWAELLSADDFSRFEEEGIFNKKVGMDFLHSILEQGGSQEPMDLFVQFRGRKPSIDALLKERGIQ